MEVLKIVIWPSLVLVLAVFIAILFRGVLNDLLKRITKLSYKGTIAEVSQARQESKEVVFASSTSSSKPNEHIDRILGLCNQQTLDRVKEIIENETKITDLKDDKDIIKILFRHSKGVYLIMWFERLYNAIYGSQIEILTQCNSNHPQTKIDLKRHYEAASEKYPALYENYDYDTYFGFLLHEGLLSVNDDETYSITWIGRDFLKYIVDSGKTANKLF